jgi:hypothetical protein
MEIATSLNAGLLFDSSVPFPTVTTEKPMVKPTAPSSHARMTAVTDNHSGEISPLRCENVTDSETSSGAVPIQTASALP